MRPGQALVLVVLLLAGLASAAEARPHVSLKAKARPGGAVRVTAVTGSPFRGSLVLVRTGQRPLRVASLKLRRGAGRRITLSAARLRVLGAPCRLELRLVTRGGARVRRVGVRRRCGRTTPASPTASGGVGSPPAAARGPQATVPAPPVSSTRLHWAPPRLTAPTVIRLGTGYTYTRMDPERDYVVVLPATTKAGATVLDGGHDVVMIGGNVTVPAGTPAGRANDSYRRAIYVKSATGTVHLEGIAIDGSGGGESDAIAINAPRATVQLENVRATGIRGGYSTWHADVIQPWGGVEELRVDGLTASSNYQGLQLNRDQGPIGSAKLRRVDLSQDAGPYDKGGFMLWLTNSACDGYPVSLDQVYVTPRAGRTLHTSLWPDDRACWGRLPISGRVESGRPPAGPFVPAGSAGTGYRSPGYAVG